MNVLLVDDEKVVLDGMQYMFAHMRPQHRVVAALTDPIQVYEHMATERIDLVITDVRMPGVYGTELAKWIKANYPDTNVLVVSAYSDFEYVRTFIQVDAEDYLLKPVAAEELLECIDGVERKVEAAANMSEFIDRQLSALQAEQPNIDPQYSKRQLVRQLAPFNAPLESQWQQMPDYINRSLRFISDNYMDDIKLIDAASAVYVNPSYLSTQFKKYIGKSFNQYLNVLRIDQAKRLLSTNACKVYEVSARVGFQDPSYFNSVFKRLTGMTPKRYQEGKLQ